MRVGGSREALSDSFARKMASWDPVEALSSGACGAEWMLVAGGRAAMGPPESKSWSSSIIAACCQAHIVLEIMQCVKRSLW